MKKTIKFAQVNSKRLKMVFKLSSSNSARSRAPTSSSHQQNRAKQTHFRLGLTSSSSQFIISTMTSSIRLQLTLYDKGFKSTFTNSFQLNLDDHRRSVARVAGEMTTQQQFHRTCELLN